MAIKILRTDSNDADFRELVKLLDAELAIRDGDEHLFYAQYNKLDKIREVIIAFENEAPIGCGAFKGYEPHVAEIKRMYVRGELRGKGVAGLILRELEAWARELNFKEAILETGLKQPEAIALYKKSGYEVIPNYGQYAGLENSVCMKKSIGS